MTPLNVSLLAMKYNSPKLLVDDGVQSTTPLRWTSLAKYPGVLVFLISLGWK
jgi:hypothetical protein